MIVGVAGILLLSGPVGADGAAAGTRGERSGRRGSERARERVLWRMRERRGALPDLLTSVPAVWAEGARGKKEAHGPKYMLPRFEIILWHSLIHSFLCFATSLPFLN